MARPRKCDPDKTVIRPQKGPQEAFLSSPADICVFGGSAGSGKSYGLLLDPLRYRDNPNFNAVIFRRTFPEIIRAGGLWEEASKLYTLLGAKPRVAELKWVFPSGMTVTFSHLQHEQDIYSWQGSAVAFIGFDEAVHFSENSFWYLLSRNRSTCGVRPYSRLTCNPDADSWLARFLEWWIGEDGYPIPERSGVLRYFFRVGGSINWADSKEELYHHIPSSVPKSTDRSTLVKSATFIPAKIYDNQALLKANPDYLGALLAQSPVEKARLLEGNWLIRPSGGNVFQAEWFCPPVERRDLVFNEMKLVRAWDLAGSEPRKGMPDPDYTAGVLLGKSKDGMYFVLDARKIRGTPGKVARFIHDTAKEDGRRVKIVMEEEPGSAGKFVTADFTRMLDGFVFKGIHTTGDKVERANPAGRQAEAGNMKIVKAGWNNMFLAEIPYVGSETSHDDIGDALSLAHSQLAGPPKKGGVIAITTAKPIPKEVKRRMSPFGNVWDNPNQVITGPPEEPKPLGIFDV